MEDEKLPPYVQYHPNDASVMLVQGGSAPLQAPPNRAQKCRCTAMGLLKVAVTVFLVTTVAALALFFLQRGELTPNAEYLKMAALPDVSNFTLVAADNHYITLAWDQPPRGIDFYLLDVTDGSGYENDSLWKHHAGSCRNGTFIRAGQTQVTCGPFDACSNLSVTIRTYTTGPPERTSMGTTLKDLFINAPDPSVPRSITMVAKSPFMTRLLWEPPTRIHGLVDVYKVKVCETFSECDQKQNLSDCVDHEASDTWLDFDSTEDTPYCVLISASAWCGGKVLTGLPATQEVRTPSFALPDVSNLKPVGVKSGHITLSWKRPKGHFDYYSVEVTEEKVSSKDAAKHRLGLCANGTIIRPDQTELTCGPLEPCNNLSCTMRTHLSGPPERSSPGVTLTGIFIPAEDPNPPTNITMFPESPSRTRIHWGRPEKVSGIMESYILKICSTFGSCVRPESLGNCTEHVTIEPWAVFDSIVDTPYCVLVTAKTRCGVDEVSSRPLIAEIRTPLFGLPDATNLRLISTVDNSITVAWERPKARFDYFWLSIADSEDEGQGNAQSERFGSCGNGMIIHPNQTWTTCPNLEACTKVSVTLRAHRSGPREHTSRGVSLKGIFIPGEDPDPPKKITMVGKSPSHTRLQWEASEKAYGRILAYTVKICDTFKSCVGEGIMYGCIELQAHEPWLDFRSSVDTKYCVRVTTRSQCGEQVLNSRPAVAEIRTPLFELPDVYNLTSVDVTSGRVTLSWQRPKGRFDYYSIEVTEDKVSSNDTQRHKLGLCANGIIIRPDQTEITCGPFVPCTSVSCTLRTHLYGPPERSSSGVTLNGIFIPAEDPNPPVNITMVPITPSLTRLHWHLPEKMSGVIESYRVMICRTFGTCDQRDNSSNCVESMTSVTWTLFNSTEDTLYCVMVTAEIRCGIDEVSSKPLIGEIRTPLFGLPDATNLRLLSAVDNSITVAWERPQARFDYYWVTIAHDEDEGDRNAQREPSGSCGNGMIIHPNQTRVTCPNLEACTKVSFILRAHRNGPPERTSRGVTLHGIFIPGQDPDPPKNITMVGKSSSLTRLQWEASAKVYGTFLAYTVIICDTFKYCDGGASMHSCIELQTNETWLDFDSSVDTKYCVRITTSSQCGEQVLNGRPAVAEIRTPLLVLPDVTNLHLKAADSHYITVVWDPPPITFDFYWLDVTKEKDNETESVQKHHAGSCGNGTIIRAEQTQVTCGPFDPCSNISVTVRTFIKGPPARSSMGTSLKGVFLSGQDPNEPKSITIVGKSSSRTRLQWEPPTRVHGVLNIYKVKVCKEFTICDTKESTGGCIEHTVSEAWLDFESTADTSYCALITASARCGVDVLTSPPATLEIRTPLFDLPDVRRLSLLSAANNSITIAWERPNTRFDYYWVYVTSDESKQNGSVQTDRAGSCANGTIIHAAATRVTCTNLEACTQVNVSIRTHRSGPPEHTSHGAGLKGIFIPGQDTDPPKDITMVGKSTSLTRLQWEPPAKVSGTFRGYMVKICDSFKSCGRETNTSGCMKFQTYDTWLDFSSSGDTKYCVLVTTSSQCGVQVLNGRPMVAEIRTPLLVAPDVTKLRLVTVGTDSFTAAWEKPKSRFDYYSVEVISGDRHPWVRQTVTVGSCAIGTIIHPDKTQVTCNQLTSCSKVSFKVRTHINGPPSRTSPGITLNEILIPERVLSQVANLKLAKQGFDFFFATFQAPKNCFDEFYYTITYTRFGNHEVKYERCAHSPLNTFPNPPNTFVVKCTKVEACGFVDFAVGTRFLGPPRRDSLVFLRRIFFNSCRI